MTIDLRQMQREQKPVEQAPVERARRPRSRQQRLNERIIMAAATAAVGLFLAGLLYFIVTKATHAVFSKDEDPQALVEAVARHMVVPGDEEPTIATVSDLNALKDQAFFRNAQVGDKVLIYMKSQRAILYSPSLDRILEVGPVTGVQ